jgi:hypothetical protein
MAALVAACGQPSAVAAGEGTQGPDSLEMRTARAAHAAVALPGGRVLLIGGCVAESCEGGPESATIDAFDPRTRSFEPAGTLTMRRVSTTAVVLASGEVLIAGGWDGPAVTSSVELFDPATGKSRRVGELSEARADIAAVTLSDGRVLLAGGYGEGGAKAAVDIYDPRSGSLSRAGHLLMARAGAGAALLGDGRVLLVAGGANAAGGLAPTASAEIFDPAANRSWATGSLTQARYKHATVGLGDGRVLVLGGSDARDAGGKLRSVERFDPRKGAFVAAGRLMEARYKIAGAWVLLADGKVFIAGGARRPELYDPDTLRSVPVGPDLGRRLNFATASPLPDGAALIAGGYDESGIRMNDRAWVVRPR